jgi:predicted acetylornithine/succinylornithine family transaminase
VTLAELEALERDYLMPTYARFPVEWARGEGCRLWDSEGREYLDLFAGVAVAQLGHCHPAVVAAAGDQLGRLLHTSNLYYSEPSLRLAERLARGSLGGKVFFANSGAEANECAIKLARRHRPRGELVVLAGAFHGRTLGALSATPQEARQEPFAPLVPGFRVVPREDPEALAAAVGGSTAAVLVEPIQGEGGVKPIPEAVLAAAREACDRHGALLVFDEVQTGVGRTGTLWAWQGVEVRPDVMTTAKGLGGGLPIGACVTAPEHADLLRPGDHGSTFAGGPVVAAAALAVLEQVERPGFLAAVVERGRELEDGLRGLGLEGVRGRGLMLAFEHPEAPAVVRRALLEQRLVVNATGPTTVRLVPPLVISADEVADGLERLARALG